MADIAEAAAAAYIAHRDVTFSANVVKRVAQGQQLRARSLAWKQPIEQRVLLKGGQYVWWRPTWDRAARNLAA